LQVLNGRSNVLLDFIDYMRLVQSNIAEIERAFNEKADNAELVNEGGDPMWRWALKRWQDSENEIFKLRSDLFDHSRTIEVLWHQKLEAEKLIFEMGEEANKQKSSTSRAAGAQKNVELDLEKEKYLSQHWKRKYQKEIMNGSLRSPAAVDHGFRDTSSLSPIRSSRRDVSHEYVADEHELRKRYSKSQDKVSHLQEVVNWLQSERQTIYREKQELVKELETTMSRQNVSGHNFGSLVSEEADYRSISDNGVHAKQVIREKKELEIRCAEFEAEIEALKSQKERLKQQFEQDENEWKSYVIVLRDELRKDQDQDYYIQDYINLQDGDSFSIQRTMDWANKVIKALRSSRDYYREKMQDLNDRLYARDAEESTTNNVIRQHSTEKLNWLNQEQRLKEKVHEIEAEKDVYENRMKELNTNLRELSRQADALRQKNTDLSVEVNLLRSESVLSLSAREGYPQKENIPGEIRDQVYIGDNSGDTARLEKQVRVLQTEVQRLRKEKVEDSQEMQRMLQSMRSSNPAKSLSGFSSQNLTSMMKSSEQDAKYGLVGSQGRSESGSGKTEERSRGRERETAPTRLEPKDLQSSVSPRKTDSPLKSSGRDVKKVTFDGVSDEQRENLIQKKENALKEIQKAEREGREADQHLVQYVKSIEFLLNRY